MKEKIAKFPSYSTEYLDDGIGGDDPDLDPMISDISEQKTSDAESEPELQNHLATWARQTLSSAGENIGNLDDPRRTKSDFQRAGIAISCYDNLMYKNYYLMIILDPKSYYHAQKYLRWQVAMDEEFNSVRKNATWELVSVPPGRKLVQCTWYIGKMLLYMEQNKNINHIWLQKGSPRSKEWTIMRPLHRRQRWTPLS